MSDRPNPLEAAFDLQRTTIERSREAMVDGFEHQRRLNEALLGGFETASDAQKRGIRLTRDALHGYLDVVESTTPGAGDAIEEIRSTVDEQFDDIETRHAGAIDAASDDAEAGVDAFEELTADSMEVFSERLDVALEAHAEIESRTLDAFKQAEAELEEMLDRVDTTRRSEADA